MVFQTKLNIANVEDISRLSENYLTKCIEMTHSSLSQICSSFNPFYLCLVSYFKTFLPKAVFLRFHMWHVYLFVTKKLQKVKNPLSIFIFYVNIIRCENFLYKIHKASIQHRMFSRSLS